MKDFDYQHWLATAQRFSRRRDEATDLLHDALVDAIRAERCDFSREANRAWFNGVLRNRAAMTARSIARRKKRESIERPREVATSPDNGEDRSFLDELPKASRSVATLILAGMTKAEIVSALKLSDTAFRQRLTSIRRAWRQRSADDVPTIARESRDDIGLIRRALLKHLKWKATDVVGTHDPDGHLIVLDTSKESRSRNSDRRQR